MRIVLCLLLFSFLFIPVALKRATCGFKLAKLRLEMPHRPDWESSSSLSQEELSLLLSQPFSYLDKGAQCYVFESRDRDVVIKLFRYDQPHFKKKKNKTPFSAKIEKLFAACLLAYNEAKEETGLIYLHLNLTRNEMPILRAIGPIGQTLHLPLDNYRFAIQKKAEGFRHSFEQAATNPIEMQQKIDSFLSLLKSRIEKGIGNSDPTLSRNFGFLQGRAVEIDFGNYYRSPASKKEEFCKYTHRLRRWLKKSAPEWVAYLDEKVEKFE